jgi:prophage antirepressor-like protein
MSAMQVFEFIGQEIRFVGTPEAPEWVGSDVVDILYPAAARNRDWSKYLEKVPDEWKGRKEFPTLGGLQEVATIFEPGLYHLIARSNSPIAIPFQKWVFEEVLPSIRKTGSYSTSTQKIDFATDPVGHYIQTTIAAGCPPNVVATEASKLASKIFAVQRRSTAPRKPKPQAVKPESVPTATDDELRGFLAKLRSLEADGELGEWCCRWIEKKGKVKVYAIALPRVWAVMLKAFDMPYKLGEIQQAFQAHGVRKSRQSFDPVPGASDRSSRLRKKGSPLGMTRWCYELPERFLAEWR